MHLVRLWLGMPDQHGFAPGADGDGMWAGNVPRGSRPECQPSVHRSKSSNASGSGVPSSVSGHDDDDDRCDDDGGGWMAQ